MRRIAVRGIGVCARGLPNWAHALRVLTGREPFDPGLVPTAAPAGLPPTERRRVNETSRLSCLAAADALAMFAPDTAASTPAIFISSDGDGAVLAQMLRGLAQCEIAISPTVFHNSVYNAPAGYWSIATRSTAPSTTLCADAASIAVGLMEAYAQAHATGKPVLVVAADAPFPEEIRMLGASALPFAFALLIDIAHGSELPRLERLTITRGAVKNEDAADPLIRAFAGNTASAVLPILRALARGERAGVALPYLDGSRLEVDVLP